MEITDYQILLIIITIIGFIISISFYIYFVYLPASRIENQFENINQEGLGLIDNINNKVPVIKNEVAETLTSLCKTFNNIICSYNASTIANCDPNNPSINCALGSEAYPAYCNQYVEFTCNGCTPTSKLKKL